MRFISGGGAYSGRLNSSYRDTHTALSTSTRFLHLRNHLMTMLAHGCDSSRRFWADELGICFPSQFMASWRLS